MPRSTPRQAVLVGHCGPDTHLLRAAVQRVIPGAPIAMVSDHESLQGFLTPDSVLFINRVLDGFFTKRDGIELIQSLAALDSPPAMILISNYPEAQESAVAAGARRGFGKAQLYHDDTAAILREALHPHSALD